jgi:hypothetical protein
MASLNGAASGCKDLQDAPRHEGGGAGRLQDREVASATAEVSQDSVLLSLLSLATCIIGLAGVMPLQITRLRRLDICCGLLYVFVRMR